MVIFHAFPESLRGGFAGVDIFFVISGFLISSILFRNLLEGDTSGRVRIVDFYIRRIKRIFPALITVLVSCLIFGWYVLLPEEFESLGKHVAGGATYVSNFMLYFEDGDYFNKSTALKPLMHLWSLGVEEQFYIVFPILLWLVYRSNLNFLLFLIVFTVASFCINRNGVNHGSQAAAFYLPWSRFWELSSGAILAYIVNYCQPQLQALRERFANSKAKAVMLRCLLRRTDGNHRGIPACDVVSFIGIALIICGYVTIRNGVNFPGTKALLPVCGALCVIAAGKESFINRHILSNRVMVFLGLISYPLYLWHWPLLSFAHIIEGENLTLAVRLGAVALAIILATVTYLVIEPPLRYGKHLGAKAVGLFAVLLAVGVIGFFAYKGGVKANIASTYSTDFSMLKQQMNKKWLTCKKEFPTWVKQNHHCQIADPTQKKIVSVFGDSHADHLSYGLQQELPKHGWDFNMFAVSMQIPFYGFMSGGLVSWRIDGSDLQDKAFLKELDNPDVSTFLFVHNAECSFWPEYQFVDKMAWLEQNDVAVTKEEKYRKGFKRTMNLIANTDKKVLFVFDDPHLPFEPSVCAPRPVSLTTHKCTYDRKLYEQEPSHALYEKVIREEIVNYPNAAIVELAPLFCNDEECSAVKDGKLLYGDKDHLTKWGSLMVAPTIAEALMKLDAKN